MIKALLLIFDPGGTWDRIVQARKSIALVLIFQLLPILAVSIGGELYGLVEWGRHMEYARDLTPISQALAIRYGASQFVMSMLVVFVGATLVKSFGETFHSRHNYTQCFNLVAYALGPLFLVRVADAFAAISPWVSFSVGMALTVAVLYQGVPRVMQPDPSHAFGLYLTSAVLLAITCGLGRLVTLLVLDGKIKFLQAPA